MRALHYWLTSLTALSGCLSVQLLALKGVGGRTTKSESNYFSSLGRIQAGARGEAEVMLLGSSITGRLPDRVNGFEGFANMGCDGGCAVDALRAMDRGFLPVAPVLVVEANTLGRALDPLPSEVGQAMSQPWFQAGIRVPMVSAFARPSAFFYSILLARKIGGFGDPSNGPDLEIHTVPGPFPADLAAEAEPTAEEIRLGNEMVEILGRLKSKGSRVIFIWVPPGRGGDGKLPSWIARIIQGSGSEWWDVGHESAPGFIELTDGIHMSAGSAARTVRTLAKELP